MKIIKTRLLNKDGRWIFLLTICLFTLKKK